VWWDRPVIPTLGRLIQEDCKFIANLGYMETLSQKINKSKKIKENSTGLTDFAPI
jgi:hypothetical protein